MSKPRTEAQIAAARANGAKSRGPVTAEGKANSARNAVTHGITARAVVLGCESQENFNALLAEFIDEYAPADTAEFLCVEQMVVATWRIRRIWSMERATLDRQVDEQYDPGQPFDPHTALGVGYDKAHRRLESFSQHETRLDRLYARAEARLERLQAIRRAAEELVVEEEEIAQNEPERAMPIHIATPQKTQNEPGSGAEWPLPGLETLHPAA